MDGNNQLAKFVLEYLQRSPPEGPVPVTRMVNVWNRKTPEERSHEYRVNESLMRRAVRAVREGRAVGVPGFPTRMEDTMLRAFILQKIDEEVEHKTPIQPEDLLDHVNQYIQDQAPEDARSHSPLNLRQLDSLVSSLGVRRVTLLPVENARITKSNMNEVVRFAEQYVYALACIERLTGHGVEPWQVLNFDEVGVGGHYVKESAQYGYVPPGTNGKFYRASNPQSNHITVVVATSPAPRVCAGGLIISRQRLEGHPRLPGVLERHIETLKEFGWSFLVDLKASSMTKDTLMQWMPCWLKDYRRRNGMDSNTPLIVFTDGHASRYNPKLWDALREDRIFLILLPAHLTHVFQPVDTHLARMIKKRRDLWGMKFEGVGAMHPMRTLGGVLRHILAVAVGGAEHKEAWLSDGLYPLNLTCFDGRGFLDQKDPELKATFLKAPLEFTKLCKYIKALARKHPYPVTDEQVCRRQLGGTCVTHNEEVRRLRASITEEIEAGRRPLVASGNKSVAGKWLIGAGDATADTDGDPTPINAETHNLVLEEEIELHSAPDALELTSSDDDAQPGFDVVAPPPRKRRRGG